MDKICQVTKTLFVLFSLLLVACTSNQADKSTSAIKTPIPISVQLWSVKEMVKQDFEGTLTKLSEMGFQGVEFAGDFGPYEDDAKGLKRFLDSVGLKPSGAHVGMKFLKNKDSDKLLDFLKEVGVELVIVPADDRAWDDEGIESLVNDLNQLSARLEKKNLRIGYHNHEKEFGSFLKQTYWDYIAQNTYEDVLLQLDVGWVNFAGKDAEYYVKRYPGRTLTTHIKIRTKGSTGINTIIGQDKFDWGRLVQTYMSHGGTRWLVVEQEEHPDGFNFLTAVEASKKGLLQAIEGL